MWSNCEDISKKRCKYLDLSVLMYMIIIAIRNIYKFIRVQRTLIFVSNTPPLERCVMTPAVANLASKIFFQYINTNLLREDFFTKGATMPKSSRRNNVIAPLDVYKRKKVD